LHEVGSPAEKPLFHRLPNDVSAHCWQERRRTKNRVAYESPVQKSRTKSGTRKLSLSLRRPRTSLWRSRVRRLVNRSRRGVRIPRIPHQSHCRGQNAVAWEPRALSRGISRRPEYSACSSCCKPRRQRTTVTFGEASPCSPWYSCKQIGVQRSHRSAL